MLQLLNCPHHLVHSRGGGPAHDHHLLFDTNPHQDLWRWLSWGWKNINKISNNPVSWTPEWGRRGLAVWWGASRWGGSRQLSWHNFHFPYNQASPQQVGEEVTSSELSEVNRLSWKRIFLHWNMFICFEQNIPQIKIAFTQESAQPAESLHMETLSTDSNKVKSLQKRCGSYCF